MSEFCDNVSEALFRQVSDVGHQSFNVIPHSSYNVCSVLCLTPRKFFVAMVRVYRPLCTGGRGELSFNKSLRLYIEVACTIGRKSRGGSGCHQVTSDLDNCDRDSLVVGYRVVG